MYHAWAHTFSFHHFFVPSLLVIKITSSCPSGKDDVQSSCILLIHHPVLHHSVQLLLRSLERRPPEYAHGHPIRWRSASLHPLLLGLILSPPVPQVRHSLFLPRDGWSWLVTLASEYTPLSYYCGASDFSETSCRCIVSGRLSLKKSPVLIETAGHERAGNTDWHSGHIRF